MSEFHILVFASGLDPAADDFEQRFYDAGCGDALVAFQSGRIVVDFTREAESLEAAIASAVADVRRAGAVVTASTTTP